MTLAVACIAGISVGGADDDLNALQQRIDRLDALTQRIEAALTVQTSSVTVLNFLQAINT